MSNANLSRIAQLNDRFRQTFSGGKVMMTQGIASLSQGEKAEVLAGVQRFDTFCPGNDPHGEHDFGALNVAGRHIYFKIDCYDPTMTFGSEDPADPEVTIRVLTIMLAEEY